ncbi:hypothetical protein [Achromobacter pestifer]|uniref:Lipoprotein n=1 Tax=Achromobacter pestifer TaxID=1353889 RepID=A0A6S6ZPF7_9BURK|nr:hypothetical protein [Achromobacter pestifer]CAB3678624.1 hypothetical protein LMG3431_04242 [Achromobacter pestifer]
MQRKWLAVIGIAAWVALAACGKKNEYPENVRLVTYSSCVEGFKKSARGLAGADVRADSYCRCVVDGLQKSVPLKDYVTYDRMLVAGENGPERERIEALVSPVVNMCVEALMKE